MREIRPPATAAAPSARDFVVEDLKEKLRAAAVRERELHQHLLHHMEEKDSLVNHVAELQRVCEALLLSQMQGTGGPAATAATTAAAAALSATTALNANEKSYNGAKGIASDAAGDIAAEPTTQPDRQVWPGTDMSRHAAQQQCLTSSSLKAIMGTVASAPAAAVAPNPGPLLEQDAPSATATAGNNLPSSGTLKTIVDVRGAGSSNASSVVEIRDGGGKEEERPSSAPVPLNSAVARHMRPAGSGPAIDIPQLLLERGGRIRITALWEAYQARFGETRYTLKDLFSMVKAGEIPFVVHEPPAGIRLLPSAPVYQQRQLRQEQLRQQQLLHQQQLQQQQLQQQQLQHQQLRQLRQHQRQAAAQAAFIQAYRAQDADSASPATSATGNTGADIGTNGVAPPHQQRQQPQQSQAFALPPTLGYPSLETDQQRSLDDTSTGCVPGTTASDDDNKDDAAEAAGDSDGWAEDKQEDDSEQQIRFGISAAPSQAAGRASDAGVDGVTSRPHAVAPQKRGVDWKELKGNLNFLLKEEGELTGRDLNHAFQQRFGKSPFLDGTPLRYAVSAGWLKGVCYDLTNKCFNLTVRVPAGRREDPPDGAPAFPPTGSQLRAGAPCRDVPRSLSPDDFDWGRLSNEFRRLLLQGALEPKEVHVKYHREFRKRYKPAQPTRHLLRMLNHIGFVLVAELLTTLRSLHMPLILGEGYNMRQAVTAGLLVGITFDAGSRRLMCA